MGRLPYLEVTPAAPPIAKMMRAQKSAFGIVFNATRMMGYCLEITKAADGLGVAIERSGHIEQTLRYLPYIRVAGLNGCPLRLDLNALRGMQEGLSKDKITAIENYATDAKSSARERLALTYADRITLSEEGVDGALFSALTDEFGRPEVIVELPAMTAGEAIHCVFPQC